MHQLLLLAIKYSIRDLFYTVNYRAWAAKHVRQIR